MSLDPGASGVTHGTAQPGLQPDLDVNALAERFRAVFPHMGTRTAPLVLVLYRLLAAGRPVSWQTLAEVAAARGVVDVAAGEAVRSQFADWPGLYETADGITGFGGLSIRPVSEHRMVVEGRTLYTRCAWDTLFLPELLGKTAVVHSRCGHTGAPVRLTVTPQGLSRRDPSGLLLSMLAPRSEMAADLTALF